MRRRNLILAFAWIAAILTGCAREYEKPSLEDMAMIGVIGFDYIDQNNMKVSVSVPVSPDRKGEKTQVYKTTATLTSQSMLELSTKAERTMSLAQLRVILFSEEYARKVGVGPVVLDLYRNPAVGENVYIAIVKGRAEEFVDEKYTTKPPMNTYFNDLLRPRVETAFSSFTTIHDFVYMMTSQVWDPNLPYLVKKGENVEISKVALLRKDKLVGFYSQRQGKLVQAMLRRKSLPRMNFLFPIDESKGRKKEQAVFDFVWNKADIRSNGSKTYPVITIRLEMRGSVIGYEGPKDLQNNKQVQALKKQLEGAIKKEAQSMLVQFQKEGVDPAAMEESLRQKYYGKWNREIGRELYKKAKFDVHVHLEVVGFGTIK